MWPALAVIGLMAIVRTAEIVADVADAPAAAGGIVVAAGAVDGPVAAGGIVDAAGRAGEDTRNFALDCMGMRKGHDTSRGLFAMR